VSLRIPHRPDDRRHSVAKLRTALKKRQKRFVTQFRRRHSRASLFRRILTIARTTLNRTLALAAHPAPNFPRLRALALFGRRPPEQEAPLVMPASKNLHKSGHSTDRFVRGCSRCGATVSAAPDWPIGRFGDGSRL